MNGAHEEPQITPDLREPPASGALTWGEPGELRLHFKWGNHRDCVEHMETFVPSGLIYFALD